MIRNPHPFEAVVSYCENMSGVVPDYLNELERETYLKMLSPQMVSGPHLGQFLFMISSMIQPKTVVEIGTFTGYSALSMWRGLHKDGVLHTYEVNPEIKWISEKYFKIAGAQDQIKFHLQDILEHDYELPENIDLSWVDADKKMNPLYFEKLLAKTRKGGLIMIDNTLWSGKVLEDDVDPITQSIKDFSAELVNDDRVFTIMLPIRDGVTIAIKK